MPLSRNRWRIIIYIYIQLDQVLDEVEQFDIVHFHVGYLHFPLFNRQSVPHITTLHGRLDIDDLAPLDKRYEDIPLVSVSDDQRRPLP